ncbi:MAG: ribonuclease HI [Planctomyces sp.]|nr:ribonuclease HI [Planctomyces sp.]
MATEDRSNIEPLKEITIFTDGGAVPNPGNGGYGVVLRFGDHYRELSGGFKLTTNNRMELMAVIAGLEALKEKCRVRLHSDSKYIVDAINNGAAKKWRANEWLMGKSKTKRAKNQDLWERLLSVYEKHDVEFVWVKGHAGIDDNERCDQLAEAALNQTDLPDDVGYSPPAPGLESQPSTEISLPMTSKIKITEVGQPCRKCQTPVIKQVPKKKTVKPNQTYYYSWYLFCPGCKAMYMVEDAKREVEESGSRLFHNDE